MFKDKTVPLLKLSTNTFAHKNCIYIYVLSIIVYNNISNFVKRDMYISIYMCALYLVCVYV